MRDKDTQGDEQEGKNKEKEQGKGGEGGRGNKKYAKTTQWRCVAERDRKVVG